MIKGFVGIPHISHIFTAIRLPRELIHIYLLAAARSVIAIAGGLFVPLLLFQEYGVTVALLYMAVYGLVNAIGSLSMIYLVDRIIVERFGVLSLLMAAVSFFVVSQSLEIPYVLLAAGLLGISGSLYWLPHHAVYALYGGKEQATSYSNEVMINHVIEIVAPVVLGVLISVIGDLAFLAASVLAFLVALLILKKGETVIETERMRNYTTRLFTSRIPVYMMFGIILSLMVLIPIFIFSQGLSVSDIGFLASGVIIARTLMDRWLGKTADKKREYSLAAIGLLLSAIMVLHIIFFPAYAHIFYVLMGFFIEIYSVVATSWLYRVASVKGIEEIPAYEVAVTSGRILALSIGSLPLMALLLFLSYIYVAAGVWLYYITRLEEDPSASRA